MDFRNHPIFSGVPELAELEDLTMTARETGAELKFAVVDTGTVTFYELLDLKLAVFADYRHQAGGKKKRKRDSTGGNYWNGSKGR